MKKSDLKELVQDMRRCFDSGETLRFHIQHYKSGMGCRVRAWHPDGHTIATVGGCGFDREGTALGYLFEMFFGEELQKLPLPKKPKALRKHGLYEHKGRKGVDGGCGWKSMLRIGDAMGLDVERYDTSKRSTIVFIRRKGQ